MCAGGHWKLMLTIWAPRPYIVWLGLPTPLSSSFVKQIHRDSSCERTGKLQVRLRGTRKREEKRRRKITGCLIMLLSSRGFIGERVSGQLLRASAPYADHFAMPRCRSTLNRSTNGAPLVANYSFKGKERLWAKFRVQEWASIHNHWEKLSFQSFIIYIIHECKWREDDANFLDLCSMYHLPVNYRIVSTD